MDELVSEALELPVTGRAELAEQLLESLDNLSEAEIEKLWIEEAERRYEAYEAGQVKAAPAVTKSSLVCASKRRRGLSLSQSRRTGADRRTDALDFVSFVDRLPNSTHQSRPGIGPAAELP